MLMRRLDHAAYSQWGVPCAGLSEDLRPFAWQVPAEVTSLIPDKLKKLMGYTVDDRCYVVKNLDLLDVCAGRARTTRWGTHVGLTCVPIDRLYCDRMDLLTDDGFALVLLLALRLRRGALATLGPQCSSWVWLSRSVTQRKPEAPAGNVKVKCVQEGNELNRRIALLVQVISLSGAYYIVEQPLSSLFFHTDAMKTAIEVTSARKVTFDMGNFGHMTKKPSIVVGNVPWLDGIQTFRCEACAYLIPSLPGL